MATPDRSPGGFAQEVFWNANQSSQIGGTTLTTGSAHIGGLANDPPGITNTNQTPLSGSATGAAGAITATLTAAATGKTAFIAGFAVTGSGATSLAVVTVTVTGTITGTLSFKVVIPASSAGLSIQPLIVPFSTPLAASGINTNIVVNVPSFGAGNTDVAACVWGFLQ